MQNNTQNTAANLTTLPTIGWIFDKAGNVKNVSAPFTTEDLKKKKDGK